MPDDFESRFVAFAERTMRIRAHCAGDDATRIYLVMPFLELLGYDAGDPSVIVPEHEDGINFAVMVDNVSSIAIEAVGAALPVNRAYARLRAYCESHRLIRVAIATNGVVFEAFTDSQLANELDEEPFMRIDLANVAKGEIDAQAVDFLKMMRATSYNPDAIAEQAFAFGLRERLKSCLLAEFRNPSEALCRLMLDGIGIRNVRSAAIDQHYRAILKTALEHAVVVPVVQALRHLSAASAEASPVGRIASETPPIPLKPTEVPIGERLGHELAAFGRMKRRSA
jgi:predicted type IV restriction endonuclease